MLQTSAMRHLLRALCAAAVAGTLASAPVVDAQPVQAGDYTPDAARGVFVDAGYNVAPAITWDWVVPPVSTFRVADTARDRELLVAVYDNAAQAQRDERRLPSGYTSSTWIYNVALFESTELDYRRLTDVAARRATGMQPADKDDLQAAAQPEVAVEQLYTDLLFPGSASVSP